MGKRHTIQTNVVGAETDAVPALDIDIPSAESEIGTKESGALLSCEYCAGRDRSLFPSGVSAYVYQ